MATVVSIMDRESWEADTDNIVVVLPPRKLLLWLPRDLWCPNLNDRINRAFALGRHEKLAAALREHSIDVRHGICLRREVLQKALEGVQVTVPVREKMAFWYPLEPQSSIEQGRKIVTFEPPRELLSGERIHQWIGARYATGEGLPVARGRQRGISRLLEKSRGARRTLRWALPDLDRIERQKVLVRQLMHEGFDFSKVLENPESIAISSPRALDEIRKVRSYWRFRTFDNVEPRMIRGMQVLVRRKK